MGQYFMAVNHTRKEFVCPWCIGGLAKLIEWTDGVQAGIFPYLLRRSDGLGGGDVPDPGEAAFAGRWAGDEVELVGDYDSSDGYERARAAYMNISIALAEEFNEFVGSDDLKLQVEECSTCLNSHVRFMDREAVVAVD